jgi:hypothetical protein
MRKLGVCLFIATGAALFAQSPQASWLDMPLSGWNAPGSPMPRAVTDDETMAELSRRCPPVSALRGTPGERTLSGSGWVPFHMFDRAVALGDVEIVAGLAGADGMCRPVAFNVFVFVGGRLAGTLSPAVMDSRTDASIGGAIRLAEDGTIAAEFSRYAAADPLCCPSGRVTVRYRIDRSAGAPVVVPVSVRPTRP